MLWVEKYNRPRGYNDTITWFSDKPSNGEIVFLQEIETPNSLMAASKDITDFIPFVIDDMSHIDYIYISRTLKSTGRKNAGEKIIFDTIFDLVPTIERLKNDLHS